MSKKQKESPIGALRYAIDYYSKIRDDFKERVKAIDEMIACMEKDVAEIEGDEPTPEFMKEDKLRSKKSDTGRKTCKELIAEARALEEENDLPAALAVYRLAKETAHSRQSTICKDKIKELSKKVGEAAACA